MSYDYAGQGQACGAGITGIIPGTWFTCEAPRGHAGPHREGQTTWTYKPSDCGIQHECGCRPPYELGRG